MWFLKQDNVDTIIYIKPNKESIIGRNIGDITFPGDKSISRKHAIINVTSDAISITDLKSTFGIYINEGISQDKRLDPGLQAHLKSGDTIRFGKLENVWTLEKLDYKTCLSTVKEEISDLKTQLKELGVPVSKEWQPDCTHLTMPCITLTLKVVQALVHQRPIVSPAFWAECLRCRDLRLPLPPPERYRPRVSEAHLNQSANFDANPERTTLFRGKKFIFFSRSQLNNYRELIVAAGGESVFLKDSLMTNSQLCAPSSVVVQYSSNRLTQDSQDIQMRIDSIIKYMASKKCRAVPESDIGLAILYMSIEKYCNPLFSFASVLTEKRDIQPPAGAPCVLAPETQDLDSQGSSVRSAIVQETLRSLASPSSSCSKESVGIFDRNHFKFEEPSRGKKTKASPIPEEPASKKKHVESSRMLAPNSDQNLLFNFIEDDTRASIPKPSASLQLTFQSSKRKRSASPCKEENLFNFISEEKPKVFTSQTNSFPSQTGETVTTLNLRKSTKRMCDIPDTVDGSKEDKFLDSLSSGTPANSTAKLNTYESSSPIGGEWLCKKSFINNTAIKKEEIDASTDSDILSKLEELNLQPAIVEISNNLIAISVTDRKESFQNITNSSLESKVNFKKFSKVKPLRTPKEVISSRMLVVFEAKMDKANLDKFFNADDGSDMEDENDRFSAFMTIGKQKSVAKTRSRRL